MYRRPETVNVTFTARQATAARTALRYALGLPPEEFPVEAFVSMVSDEIQQLREAGKTYSDIAAVIGDAIGVQFSPQDLADFYASRERGRG